MASLFSSRCPKSYTDCSKVSCKGKRPKDSPLRCASKEALADPDLDPCCTSKQVLDLKAESDSFFFGNGDEQIPLVLYPGGKRPKGSKSAPGSPSAYDRFMAAIKSKVDESASSAAENAKKREEEEKKKAKDAEAAAKARKRKEEVDALAKAIKSSMPGYLFSRSEAKGKVLKDAINAAKRDAPDELAELIHTAEEALSRESKKLADQARKVDESLAALEKRRLMADAAEKRAKEAREKALEEARVAKAERDAQALKEAKQREERMAREAEEAKVAKKRYQEEKDAARAIKKAMPWSVFSWKEEDREKLKDAVKEAKAVSSPPKWLSDLIDSAEDAIDKKQFKENLTHRTVSGIKSGTAATVSGIKSGASATVSGIKSGAAATVSTAKSAKTKTVSSLQNTRNSMGPLGNFLVMKSAQAWQTWGRIVEEERNNPYWGFVIVNAMQNLMVLPDVHDADPKIAQAALALYNNPEQKMRTLQEFFKLKYYNTGYNPLKWIKTDDVKNTTGVTPATKKLDNSALEKALKAKQNFSVAEWKNMGSPPVAKDQYVEVNGTKFQIAPYRVEPPKSRPGTKNCHRVWEKACKTQDDKPKDESGGCKGKTPKTPFNRQNMMIETFPSLPDGQGMLILSGTGTGKSLMYCQAMGNVPEVQIILEKMRKNINSGKNALHDIKPANGDLPLRIYVVVPNAAIAREQKNELCEAPAWAEVVDDIDSFVSVNAPQEKRRRSLVNFLDYTKAANAVKGEEGKANELDGQIIVMDEVHQMITLEQVDPGYKSRVFKYLSTWLNKRIYKKLLGITATVPIGDFGMFLAFCNYFMPPDRLFPVALRLEEYGTGDRTKVRPIAEFTKGAKQQDYITVAEPTDALAKCNIPGMRTLKKGFEEKLVGMNVAVFDSAKDKENFPVFEPNEPTIIDFEVDESMDVKRFGPDGKEYMKDNKTGAAKADFMQKARFGDHHWRNAYWKHIEVPYAKALLKPPANKRFKGLSPDKKAIVFVNNNDASVLAVGTYLAKHATDLKVLVLLKKGPADTRDRVHPFDGARSFDGPPSKNGTESRSKNVASEAKNLVVVWDSNHYMRFLDKNYNCANTGVVVANTSYGTGINFRGTRQLLRLRSTGAEQAEQIKGRARRFCSHGEYENGSDWTIVDCMFNPVKNGSDLCDATLAKYVDNDSAILRECMRSIWNVSFTRDAFLEWTPEEEKRSGDNAGDIPTIMGALTDLGLAGALRISTSLAVLLSRIFRYIARFMWTTVRVGWEAYTPTGPFSAFVLPLLLKLKQPKHSSEKQEAVSRSSLVYRSAAHRHQIMRHVTS